MIVTLEVEFAQGAFEIVHTKTFTPNPNPVIVVFALSEFVMVPLPDISDHVPTPTVAVLAAINVFGLEIQSV